jgi:ketosteroid isomerase-like protein
VRKELLAVVAVGLCISLSVAIDGSETADQAVNRVLDTLHKAASNANSDLYFGLFAEDAVFMGTDATERWSMDEFRAFAEPYFSQGRGWTYTVSERHVYVAVDGATAWFDELLWNENYGTCRGTGVLVRTGRGWRISQYNLTIPIPNDLAGEFTARIKDFADATR